MLDTNNAKVTLLGNPFPNQSQHLWVAPNVLSLNRINKMSSMPFWVPNDEVKLFQFRLVLLRGVTPGNSQEDDPVAVYLDSVPASAEGPSSSLSSCRVTIKVVARSDDRSLDVAQEEVMPFSQRDRTFGFRDLIRSDMLNSPTYVDAAKYNAVTLRITIETGISSVVDLMSRTTDRWAASFWSSANSTVAALYHGLDSVKKHVATVNELSREEAPAAPRILPWESVPRKWADRSSKWTSLVRDHLPESDGTFLFGPERGLHEDEKVLMTQLGLNHKLAVAASKSFDYDREVHEGLLSSEVLRHQRYQLVPLRITDQAFWSNYWWKVSALSICDTDDQAQLFLSIVNSPPKVPSGGRALLTSSMGAEDVAIHIKEALETVEVLRELLGDDTSDSDSVLADSAAASCRAHIVKLTKLSSRCDANIAVGVQAALVLVTAVEQEYAAFVKRNATADKLEVLLDDSPNVHPPPKLPTPRMLSPIQSIEGMPTPTNASPVSVASRSGSKKIDFAPMPWEEDE